MSAVPSHTIEALSRHWVGRLAPYRRHDNDEHREALVAEAMRYLGMHLESPLSHSRFWSDKPLIRRAAVLLVLVDRGAVVRTRRGGRVFFEVTDRAERWVIAEASLAPYREPTLELLACLRRQQSPHNNRATD